MKTARSIQLPASPGQGQNQGEIRLATGDSGHIHPFLSSLCACLERDPVHISPVPQVELAAPPLGVLQAVLLSNTC